jgi:hypothetical protein
MFLSLLVSFVEGALPALMGEFELSSDIVRVIGPRRQRVAQVLQTSGSYAQRRAS